MNETIQYKCPSCGAVLEFDSSTQKMKCPYCDTLVDIETIDNNQEQVSSESCQVETETYSQEDSSELAIYHCESCGAEVIADKTTAAMHCPYCDNVIIMVGNLAGELKPDVIIPFKFDKKSAKEALKKHLTGKKLLPKVFSSENHLDEIKGIYVPFWLYDTDVIADATYSGTKLRTWTDTRYQYTETSYYNIKRRGQYTFDSIPVDALESIPNEMTESLEVFDISGTVPFKTAYLSGFFANRFDVSAEDCISRAKERISKSCIDSLADTVTGYSSVSKESSSIQLVNTKVRYALYPVWILNTTWRGTKYTFAMNGETGKFVGNLPTDKSISFKYRLLYGGGIAAILFLIIQLLMGGGIL